MNCKTNLHGLFERSTLADILPESQINLLKRRRPVRLRVGWLPLAFVMLLILGTTTLVSGQHKGRAQNSLRRLHEHASRFKVLVFSKTAGFRHASIPDGIAAIRNLGAANDFEVDATEEANAFAGANLAQYQAVVFLCTTGDVLDANQQAAFTRKIVFLK